MQNLIKQLGNLDALAVKDGSGSIRVIVSANERGPALGLFAPDGTPVGSLGFAEDGEMVLSLVDAAGRAAGSVVLGPRGPLFLSVDDEGHLTSCRPISQPPPIPTPGVN
ncbi:MAG: hypothetical protein ACYTG0_25935 [Planctomycetota bacterium]|jgi:hypothetical protein